MNEDFKSYVPSTESIAEFTIKSVVIGVVFGALFGAANAYLGLKAGLTVSTSIPIAVMSVAFFRLLKLMKMSSIIFTRGYQLARYRL